MQLPAASATREAEWIPKALTPAACRYRTPAPSSPYRPRLRCVLLLCVLQHAARRGPRLRLRRPLIQGDEYPVGVGRGRESEQSRTWKDLLGLPVSSSSRATGLACCSKPVCADWGNLFQNERVLAQVTGYLRAVVKIPPLHPEVLQGCTVSLQLHVLAPYVRCNEPNNA